MSTQKAVAYLLILLLGFTLYSLAFKFVYPLMDSLQTLDKHLINKLVFAVVLVIGVVVLKNTQDYGMSFQVNWKTLKWYIPIGVIALLTTMGANWDANSTTLIKIAILALAVGMAEELMFRGMVFRWFAQLGQRKQILVSAVSFGCIHLVGLMSDIAPQVILSQVYFAAGMGVIFGFARSKDYSIFLAVLVHALFDFIAIGGKGGVSEVFGDTLQMVIGLLFAGTIAWLSGAYYLWKKMDS